MTIMTVQQWMNAGGGLSPEYKRPHLGIHHNALLRRDEWLELDQAVMDTVKTPLVGIADLQAAGLVHRLGGLGTLLSAYETVSEMDAANVEMEADVPGREDRVEYGANYVPIPLIFKDFRIPQRQLLSSRRLGESLDTTQARAATRVVAETMESMLFSGHAKQLGGYLIYGYTNAPNRVTNTANGVGGGDFGTAGNGYKTVVGALAALTNLGYRPPFMAYLASTQFTQLNNLIDLTSGRSELSVIKENLAGQLQDLKLSFELSDGVLVVVAMNSEVVDLAVAEDIVPIQWDEMGGALTRFRIMTALAPRVKSDFNSHTGIAHITGC